MSEPPTYRIERPTDFLAVPPDRLDACLAEFRLWLALYPALQAQATPGHRVEPVFTWVDDGRREVTIHHPDGQATTTAF